MEELIKALQIMRKYDNPSRPTHCEHDELRVFVDPALVSEDDLKTLEELGFNPVPEDYCFQSYRYGSC